MHTKFLLPITDELITNNVITACSKNERDGIEPLQSPLVRLPKPWALYPVWVVKKKDINAHIQTLFKGQTFISFHSLLIQMDLNMWSGKCLRLKITSVIFFHRRKTLGNHSFAEQEFMDVYVKVIIPARQFIINWLINGWMQLTDLHCKWPLPPVAFGFGTGVCWDGDVHSRLCSDWLVLLSPAVQTVGAALAKGRDPTRICSGPECNWQWVQPHYSGYHVLHTEREKLHT